MHQRIGIIGLWHLGCVLAASWSKSGCKVIGFDYEERRVNFLQQGIPPLYEPYLEDQIKTSLSKKLLSFSGSMQSLSECDFIFLSYDTPVRDDDSSDTSILEKAVHDVSGVMKDGAILIVSSQSPVGYCSYLREILRAKNSTLELAYSPENLRLGEAIECYLNPGRIILGTSDASAEQKCVDLFKQITPDILLMSLESAEMVKHGINSFLAASIVFANNLADLCEENHARIDDVVKGMKSDPRIGQRAYLSAGIGFSGGTLGRDLKVLDAKNSDGDNFAKLFGFIHQSNNERKRAIVMKIDCIVHGIHGKRIGVLGLTYKPGTSTLRRSLPLEIVDLLIEKNASVTAYDPKADYSELTTPAAFEVARNIAEAAVNADLLILLTEWDEFKEYDWNKIVHVMKAPRFYDAKNCLNSSAMKASGFRHYSIGSEMK